MERIITRRITWFLETNRLLPPSQAGFREGRSTLDQILTLEAMILEGFNGGINTYAIFLDLSNAYDSTWHEAVLYKMAKLKIAGKILKWVHSFLKNRRMRVRIDGTSSEYAQLNIGVPQGSVISPLLFLIMMSDFPPSNSLCTYL